MKTFLLALLTTLLDGFLYFLAGISLTAMISQSVAQFIGLPSWVYWIAFSVPFGLQVTGVYLTLKKSKNEYNK